MASLNPQQIIYSQELTTSDATYYTVPSLTVTVVRRILFCNTTTSAVTFTVHYVTNGGAVGDDTMVIYEERLGPKKTVAPPELEGIVLEASDFISMKASANNSVTVVASGTEVVA